MIENANQIFEREEPNFAFTPNVDVVKRKLNLDEKEDLNEPYIINEQINKSCLDCVKPKSLLENSETAIKNQLESSGKAKSVGLPDLGANKNLFGKCLLFN